MPHETEEILFHDLLFRQRRKHDVYREVAAPALETRVADTHCHTHLLPDPALAFARCAAHNVGFVCNIVDSVEDAPDTFDQVRAVLTAAADVLAELAPDCANPLPTVRFAVGCHPHNAKDFDAAAQAHLRELLCDPWVAAIGEIGLDFHYDFSPRPVQEQVFRQQIQMAHELGLPICLHIREAHDLAFRILEEEGWPAAGTLLHCFNLGLEDVKPWVERGAYIALGGPVTFKKSDYTREAAAAVPRVQLLTETDAPYMTPEPMRGITCWTDHVIFTAERLAQVCGAAPGAERAAFLDQLYENALGLLNRPPRPWQTPVEG